MTENSSKTELQNSTALTNGFGDFASNLYGGAGVFPMAGMGTQLSQADSMWLNNRWYLISNYRQLISELYAEHGIIQTAIDQPVDDAFSQGFDIKSAQLSGDDVELIWNYMERHQVVETIKYSCKWARLFGGGGVFVITDQDPAKPLDIKAIKEDSPLEFRDVDMWELYNSQINIEGDIGEGNFLEMEGDKWFDYYGHRVNSTRVLTVKGKKATSFIRPRLRGWGMSELEKIVRPFNQFLKNANAVYELVDEVKVDKYGIKNFNTSLMTSGGTDLITKRVQLGNMVKNYLNALVMDVDDDWEQKTIPFTGMADVIRENRIDLACSLRMPMTKLFGMSASGFNSGEDDIENYNSMIESEVRGKVKFHVIEVVGIVCQKLFGYVPEDLTITFPSLRILNALDEEQVKNHRFNRAMSSLQSGAIDRKAWAEAINKDSLLSVEIDENDELLEPLNGDFLTGAGDQVTNSQETSKTTIYTYNEFGKRTGARVE